MFLLLYYNLFAQSEWRGKSSLSIAFTRLTQNRYSNFLQNRTNEVIKIEMGSIKFLTPLAQKFRIGLEFQNIYTMVDTKPRDRSFLINIGAFYEFYRHKRFNMSVETGYSLSNLCACGFAEQYTTDTLQHYWSLGVGSQVKIYKNIFFDIGFLNYIPLTGSFPEIYRWTRPYIGLSYYLPSKIGKKK
jgi:hypothetical protein